MATKTARCDHVTRHPNHEESEREQNACHTQTIDGIGMLQRVKASGCAREEMQIFHTSPSMRIAALFTSIPFPVPTLPPSAPRHHVW